MIALLMSLARRKRRLVSVSKMGHTVAKLLAVLAVIYLGHTFLQMIIEKMNFSDATWYTFATITTTGYGDITAKSFIGRICTIVIVGFGGIYLLADAASKVLAYRSYSLERKLNGTWRWKMKDHIVIIGTPDSHADKFFNKLVDQIAKAPSLQGHQIVLLTESFPERTAAVLIDKGVVHFTGKGVTEDELSAVSIKDAAHVLIIAGHDTDPSSDALTLDIMARMHDMGFEGSSIIELVNDANRPRALRMGADAIVRPARGYPEMLIRAMDAPGSEVILENFFDSEGSEITRINLPEPANRIWGEILFDLGKNDVGLAVGYLDASGKVITNPPFKLHIDSSVLFVIVDDAVTQPAEACLKALSIRKAKKAA